MTRRIINAFVALVALFIVSCDDNGTRVSRDDLDLGLIVGHLKSTPDASASKLEEWINSTPGVNNVDLDKDGNRDLIVVVEQPSTGDRVTFLLSAMAPDWDGSVTLAELQFEKDPAGRTIVNATYSSVVGGGHDVFYREHLSSPSFSTWLWTPHVVYVHPFSHYRTFGWANPQPTLGFDQVTTTRRTVETKVSPVKRVQKPSTYVSKDPEARRAQVKMPTRKSWEPSTSVKSTADRGTNFTLRSNAPKPKATNVTRTTPSTSTPSMPSRPVRSTSSPVRQGTSMPARSTSTSTQRSR